MTTFTWLNQLKRRIGADQAGWGILAMLAIGAAIAMMMMDRYSLGLF